jgi:hypothetical protein
LVVARYEPSRRRRNLQRVNLLLERVRHLLRLAREAQLASVRGHESALRGLDETGRMLHGWREALGFTARARPQRRPRGSRAERDTGRDTREEREA